MVTMEPEDFLFWLAKFIREHPQRFLMVLLVLILFGIVSAVLGALGVITL